MLALGAAAGDQEVDAGSELLHDQPAATLDEGFDVGLVVALELAGDDEGLGPARVEGRVADAVFLGQRMQAQRTMSAAPFEQTDSALGDPTQKPAGAAQVKA